MSNCVWYYFYVEPNLVYNLAHSSPVLGDMGTNQIFDFLVQLIGSSNRPQDVSDTNSLYGLYSIISDKKMERGFVRRLPPCNAQPIKIGLLMKS